MKVRFLRVGGLFGSSWIGLVKGRIWWKVLRIKRVNMWKKRWSSCVCSMLGKWCVQSDGKIGEFSKSINLTLHICHLLALDWQCVHHKGLNPFLPKSRVDVSR